MQTGQRQGMQTLDQSLARLVKSKAVTYDEAFSKCSNQLEFRALLSEG